RARLTAAGPRGSTACQRSRPPWTTAACSTTATPPSGRPLALAVGLVVFIAVALFRVNDTVAMVMGAIIALWVGTLVYNVITEVKQFPSAAEVTPTQCSDLYPIVEELRQRWAMPRTRVLVVFRPGLGAVSTGFMAPYLIVIDSLYARSLDDGELRYVLGR